MIKSYPYSSNEEKEKLIQENSPLVLVEEQNLSDGNFLVFSDDPENYKSFKVTLPAKEFEKLEELKKENILIKAQSQANADRADFQEELIVELAMMVYG